MKSARINFGQPNTEYKLEINDAGEATSCYNQDTETEYIGGGGGGGGDFVKLTLSCKVSTPDSEDSFNMDFSDRTTEESASYIDAFRIDPEYGIQANPESPYVLYDEPYTGEIYIIKDGCIFVYAGDRLENTYTVTGAGEIVADYHSEYAVKVTGDCEITVAGSPSE